MLNHARRLFTCAALFNGSVVLGLLLLEPLLQPWLRLESASGSNLALRDLGLALIATFALAYLCVAYRPEQFRPYIGLGVVGKCLVVVAIYAHWLAGHIGWQLPALALGDVVFSVLFVDFLNRYPSALSTQQKELSL
ncbi:MAG: hypothetical protein ACRESP_11930 [Pseudomonas sp.]